jgi:sugar phosphate isomerase/epimerase
MRLQQSTRTGIVTNVFRRQLDAGATLVELIGEAHQRDFRAFELREGAMGEFEFLNQSAQSVPMPQHLRSLREKFPETLFNIAIEFPVFSSPFSPQDTRYIAARDAAFEIRDETGHLRFVDPTPDIPLLEDERKLCEQADCLHLLAADALASGVRISIEHSRQPLSVTRNLVSRASRLLESNGFMARGQLGICYDPCNLFNSALEKEDPVTATAALTVEEILMFHIKQSRSGVPLPVVEEGDIHWATVLAAIREKGYTGPTCFEIPPADNVWENLETSHRYVRSLREPIDAQ